MVILQKDQTERYNITQSISQSNGIDGMIEAIKQQIKAISKDQDIIDCKSHVSVKDLKPGQKFYGSITTTIKDPNTGKKVRTRITDTFTVKENKSTPKGSKLTVEDKDNNTYATSYSGTQLKSLAEGIKKSLEKKALQEKLKALEEEKKKMDKLGIDFSKASISERLERLVKSGIRNLWMTGPAGSGKSVQTRMLAKKLGLPCLCISCGIGTSSTEFIGYKYPTRESTKFAEYYAKPSIILLDEFTALDPAVAQICNSALANDEIETTTGTVYRDPNCIIIATSNTFGNGASRQYVANNQLDASTIDRFVGGIIEVDYSEEFESQYDEEVVNYVKDLRELIRNYDLRRVASTRMIQAGCALKQSYIKDWKDQLIINWSKDEKRIVIENLAA